MHITILLDQYLQANPHLRLGQAIVNLVDSCQQAPSIYYARDEDLIDKMLEYFREEAELPKVEIVCRFCKVEMRVTEKEFTNYFHYSCGCNE